MSGYFVLLVDINDAERYADYARAVRPTYAAYGGRMAIRGPIVEVIEGMVDVDKDTMFVVLEFDSADQARSWWRSPEYQQIRKLREPPVSEGRAFLVSGVELAK